VPGIGFRTEKRRFYPGGPTASHILGLVNVDNQGIAGMEKYIDSQGLTDLRSVGLATGQSLEPVRLSIDIRVQQHHDATFWSMPWNATGRLLPVPWC
jgi:cell division protein FtsI (penicillin-binding protein 3)